MQIIFFFRREMAHRKCQYVLFIIVLIISIILIHGHTAGAKYFLNAFYEPSTILGTGEGTVKRQTKSLSLL